MDVSLGPRGLCVAGEAGMWQIPGSGNPWSRGYSRRHMCEYAGLAHTCLPLTHSWRMSKALVSSIVASGEHLPKSTIVITFLRASSKGFPLPQTRRALRVLQIALEKPSWMCLIPSWVQQGRQACVPANSNSAPQFSMGPTPQRSDASDKLQGRSSSSESFLQHLLEAGLSA